LLSFAQKNLVTSAKPLEIKWQKNISSKTVGQNITKSRKS